MCINKSKNIYIYISFYVSTRKFSWETFDIRTCVRVFANENLLARGVLLKQWNCMCLEATWHWCNKHMLQRASMLFRIAVHDWRVSKTAAAAAALLLFAAHVHRTMRAESMHADAIVFNVSIDAIYGYHMEGVSGDPLSLMCRHPASTINHESVISFHKLAIEGNTMELDNQCRFQKNCLWSPWSCYIERLWYILGKYSCVFADVDCQLHVYNWSSQSTAESCFFIDHHLQL